MNKEELKGKARNLKGRAKRAVGALTGNKKLEAEGAAEQLTGAGKEKLAQAKEALSADDQLASEDETRPGRVATEGEDEVVSVGPRTEDPYPTAKH
jgi:uncharacterized protein YjbJ (UPF0337 family)